VNTAVDMSHWDSIEDMVLVFLFNVLGIPSSCHPLLADRCHCQRNKFKKLIPEM